MSELRTIDITTIEPNPYQPRTEFSNQAIEELASSIKESGLLQPITVRETDSGYQLISGERRLRACKLLNLSDVEAIVIKANEVESATLAMLENIQREDLSAIEEANGYVNMIRLTGISQNEIAQKVGKSQSAIANKIRLLNLDNSVQQAISNKSISERHGRALLSLDEDQQKEALKAIIKNDFNVKKTEEYINTHFAPKKKRGRLRCFGVAARLIINSFHETFKKARELTDTVELLENEDEDNYIMTIKIKKQS